MATNPEDQHEKEGVSMADIVKALVLAWSAALLTASYLGIFPQMKMDNTFVASLLTKAMASFGIERSMAMEIRSRLLLITKTPSWHQMTRTLLVLGITLAAAMPAKADITHKIQSSVQLQVDGAASQVKNWQHSAVSGSNVSLDTAPVLGTLTAGSAVGYTPGAYSITTAGDAFSYSESYIVGDATPSNTSVSSGVVTSPPMLGNTTTTSGGVAGSLAGTIASDGAMTITAGGAGTTATGQVVLSLKLGCVG